MTGALAELKSKYKLLTHFENHVNITASARQFLLSQIQENLLDPRTLSSCVPQKTYTEEQRGTRGYVKEQLQRERQKPSVGTNVYMSAKDWLSLMVRSQPKHALSLLGCWLAFRDPQAMCKLPHVQYAHRGAFDKPGIKANIQGKHATWNQKHCLCPRLLNLSHKSFCYRTSTNSCPSSFSCTSCLLL